MNVKIYTKHSIVFCNSVSADSNGMAASRFLAAADASVTLLCFAAESQKSYRNGCMRLANGALAADFYSGRAASRFPVAAAAGVSSSTGKYFVQAS